MLNKVKKKKKYGDFKDLARRAASDEVFRDKAFNIENNSNYDGHQRGLASMTYKFLDKKSAGSDVANNEIKQNLELAEELHRPIVRNFKNRQFIQNFKTISGVLT